MTLEIIGYITLYVISVFMIGLPLASIALYVKHSWDNHTVTNPNPIVLMVVLFPLSTILLGISNHYEMDLRYEERPGLVPNWWDSEYLWLVSLLWPLKVAWNIALLPFIVLGMVIIALCIGYDWVKDKVKDLVKVKPQDVKKRK